MGRTVKIERGVRTSKGNVRPGDTVELPNREADMLVRMRKASDEAIQKAKKQAKEPQEAEAPGKPEGAED